MPAERRGGAARAAAPGEVRIVGGLLRRSVVPVVAVEGLGPTPDRVRETLFNWLGQQLPGHSVLDAFAGSGALGLEALSRGAGRVDFFETNPLIRRQLQQTVTVLTGRLGKPEVAVSVRGDDVCRHLQQLSASATGFRYDLALLDPPFRSDWLVRALPLVMQCMQPSGLIYVEWHARLGDDGGLANLLAQSGWQVERVQKAGQVHFHLLARASGADQDRLAPSMGFDG